MLKQDRYAVQTIEYLISTPNLTQYSISYAQVQLCVRNLNNL